MNPFLFALILLIASCGTESKKSSLQHDFGSFLPKNYKSYFWQETETKKYLSQSFGGDLVVDRNFITEGPAVDHLNAWISEMHDIVKTKFKREKVTKPKVVIYKARDINAYVTASSFCLDVKMKFVRSKSQKKLASMGIGLAADFKSGSNKCISSNIDFKYILKKALPIKWPSCYRFTKDSSGKDLVELSDSCITDSHLQSARRKYGEIEKFTMNLSPDIIFVSDSLLRNFTEEETLGILAHELAHYYKGHALSLSEHEAFNYRIDRYKNPSKKPKGNKDKKLQKVITNLDDLQSEETDFYKGPKGALLHPRAYSYLKQMSYQISSSCTEDACRTACLSLQNDILYNSRSNLIYAFPEARIDFTKPSYRDFYFHYEDLAKQCLSLVKNENISSFTRQLITGPNYFVFAANELDFESYENFWDTLKAHSKELSRIYLEHKKKIKTAVKEANKARLGIWTMEQEADDIALEIMQRLGLDIKAHTEIFLKFADLSEARNKEKMPGQLSAKECRKQYAKGFPSFIPIIDYIDPHHDSCFRAYNSYRERSAHRSKLRRLKVIDRLAPNAQLWESIVQSL